MNEARYLELLARCERRLFCVAKAYLRNESDCEDAYSQAILKGWNRRFTLLHEERFQVWMAKILARECLNICRKQKREQEKLKRYRQKQQTERSEYKTNTVVEMVYELPEAQRVPIILFYSNGYSLEEIADLLGISNALVKSRMYEGRKKLKIKLEGMGYDSPDKE